MSILSTRPSFKQLLPVAMSGLLLGGVLLLVESQSLLPLLKSIDPKWGLVGVALSVPQIVLCALRWSITSQRLGVPLTLGRATSEYYRSIFINQVLPFGIAGDVLRVGRQATNTPGSESPGVKRALLIVALERCFGQGVLLVLTLASLMLWDSEQWKTASWLVAAFVSFLIVALIKYLRRFSRLDVLYLEVRKATLGSDGGTVQFFLSTTIVLIFVLQYAALAFALNLQLDVVPLVMISLPLMGVSALPLFVSGWGTREALGAVLFSSLGLSASNGVALGLAFGGLQLICALPGFLLVLRGDRLTQTLQRGEGERLIEPKGL